MNYYKKYILSFVFILIVLLVSYFLINFSFLKILNKISDSIDYLLYFSLISIITVNFLVKKNYILFFVFFLLTISSSLFLKPLISYLEFLGTDSFEATTKTNWSEIKFFFSTISGLFVINKSNLYLLIFSIIISFTYYVFINLLKIKFQNLNKYFLSIFIVIITIFIYKLLIFIDTPSNFHKKVYNNFDNEIFIDEHIKGNDINLILHVGEATTSLNWSLYGYFRDTNPILNNIKKKGFLVFSNMFSTHSHTTPSLLDAFSLDIKDDNKKKYYTPYEKKKINVFEVINKLDYKFLKISNNFGNFEDIILFKNIKLIKNKNHPKGEYAFFLNNFEKLNKFFEKNSKSIAILHSYAGHGPYSDILPKKYQKKVDNFFNKFSLKEIFGNTYFSKNAKNAKLDQIEKYDSTMVFLDDLISSIISKVEEMKKPVVYIYFSDHGESVLKNRGHDSSSFVYEMSAIPFVIYFNETAQKKYKKLFEKYKKISKNENISTLKTLSPTLLDLLNIKIKNEVENLNVIKNEKKNDQFLILNRKTLKNRSYINLNNEEAPKEQFGYINKTPEDIRILSITSTNKNKKICYHRSNSIAKIIRGQKLASCLEVDLNIINDDFQIFHEPEVSSNINLSDLLILTKNYGGSIWIDLKNSYKNNNCVKMKKKISNLKLTKKILIEFSGNNYPSKKNLECVSDIRNLGFNTAYQASDDLIKACRAKNDECKKFVKVLRSEKFVSAFTHLSISFSDYNIYDDIKFLDFKYAIWGLDSDSNAKKKILENKKVEYIIFQTFNDPNSIKE